MYKDVENIIFDFDGVILDSMRIRSLGFRKIFKEYENKLVDELVIYHNKNGGLSRFVKIKYFYNKLLKKEISEKEIEYYASKYSSFMRENLLIEDLIIEDSLDFIKNNYKNIQMTVASGSEQKELRFINKSLDLAKYFKLILGSPITKTKNVDYLISELKFDKSKTILIGDSINDYDAAKYNDIRFFGYNNLDLKDISNYYIDSFKNFEIK